MTHSTVERLVEIHIKINDNYYAIKKNYEKENPTIKLRDKR